MPPWFDAVQCTRPFTVDDAAALHGMIKADMPAYAVDVYWTKGDVIHVRLYANGLHKPVFTRDLDVVV